MRRSSRFAALSAVLTMVAVLTVGCTVAGRAMPERLDIRALDLGPHSGTALAVPQRVDEYQGRVLESIRMAEAVIDPAEADPALTFPTGASGVIPLPTPAKAAAFLADPIRPVLERHGLIAGFAVGGSDRKIARRVSEAGPARLLTVVLLRLPDPEAARRAASEIDAVDAAVSPDNVPVAVPRYPAAHAHWRPNVPTLAATIAHDSYVVSLLVGNPEPDLAALTGLAGKAFDAQLPRLRDFVATPQDQLTALPRDRDGMLAHHLPEGPGRWPHPAVLIIDQNRNAGWDTFLLESGVVYGPRGAKLWWRTADNPGHLSVDRFSIIGFSFLVRYSKAADGRRLWNESGKKPLEPEDRSVPGPAGVPDVRCVETSAKVAADVKFSCKVLYGRYLALVLSRDLVDVQRRAAAQHLLLAAAE